MSEADWQDDTNLVTVHLLDSVTTGDYDRVLAAMRRAKREGKRVVALELDSLGGDGDAGLELAEFVSENNVDVLLQERCWSACSFAAMVALGRGNLLIRPGAQIGVHQARVVRNGKADRAWTERVANQLRRLGARQDMLDRMISTPPESMVIYDYPALRRRGGIVITSSWWQWWAWEK